MSQTFDFENRPAALEVEKSVTGLRISVSLEIQQILSVKSALTGECPKETWRPGRHGQ